MKYDYEQVIHQFEYNTAKITIEALWDGEKRVRVQKQFLHMDFIHTGSVAECIGIAVCKVDGLLEFVNAAFE